MSLPSFIKIGAPTLDHPFGLQLWPIFEAGFTAVKGYKPQDFRFVPGSTPFSTHTTTAVILITYYIVIFGGRELMRGRQPFVLGGLFKAHNLGLTILSGALLLLFLEQLIPTIVRNGVFYAICNYGGGWTDKLVILYYVRLAGKLILYPIPNAYTAQLCHQVPGIDRYLLPFLEEEASQ